MKGKYIKIKKQKGPKEEKEEKPESLNYGLSILKFILSFLVLTSHNFNKKSTNNKYIIYFTKERLLHVPSFFKCLFILCANIYYL